jgi:hypothetical protein
MKIHNETQYVDRRTGTSVHANLGMFVLVLMSHGGSGTISVGNETIRLVDIYRLLSTQNFPAMRGKPKMIILQSCSGGHILMFFSVQLCNEQSLVLKIRCILTLFLSPNTEP